MKLVLIYDPKPIPVRKFDWICYVDGEEEKAEYGYGPTAIGALIDWEDNYAAFS